ncbi:DUF2384 domain-containing protein [Luteolibacter ambystomatis]|uniref:DUF2384 domain-containing protein n=1 Tax=Luteolibacter ambystomatis TaxID=2824561 RepID=A0A975G565_9BACT|nr:antitoxin Xre/MbcA/ParS toxin-binding domain-containing protein [Luteolibacter ambystomatis]QUE49534.1 DUF2384 domain-containing protein [Luteolibacter ambystomatis]
MTQVRIGSENQGKDFSLYFWTPGAPEAEMRAALRKKWDWVVPTHATSTGRYAILLSNLLRVYQEPEKATVDDIRGAIEKGLNKEAFNRLKIALDAPSGELSKVVRIPERTIARREIFKPDESERILRVASAFQRAIEVLGSLDTARRWFSSAKRALGGKTPMEFCDTEPGAEEVANLLGRIEHGVFS